MRALSGGHPKNLHDTFYQVGLVTSQLAHRTLRCLSLCNACDEKRDEM